MLPRPTGKAPVRVTESPQRFRPLARERGGGPHLILGAACWEEPRQREKKKVDDCVSGGSTLLLRSAMEARLNSSVLYKRNEVPIRRCNGTGWEHQLQHAGPLLSGRTCNLSKLRGSCLLVSPRRTNDTSVDIGRCTLDFSFTGQPNSSLSKVNMVTTSGVFQIIPRPPFPSACHHLGTPDCSHRLCCLHHLGAAQALCAGAACSTPNGSSSCEANPAVTTSRCASGGIQPTSAAPFLPPYLSRAPKPTRKEEFAPLTLMQLLAEAVPISHCATWLPVGPGANAVHGWSRGRWLTSVDDRSEARGSAMVKVHFRHPTDMPHSEELDHPAGRRPSIGQPGQRYLVFQPFRREGCGRTRWRSGSRILLSQSTGNHTSQARGL